MINYEIKNRRIELTYDTDMELKLLMKFLQIIDIMNGVKK